MTSRLVALVFFISSLSFAQGEGRADLFGNGNSIIDVPLSPEAGTLERFGSIPMNGSTGHMNYGVPFYTIAVDGNSWPINLNYNYGGLILEGKPSLNGLGWSLSATGAVTREVRGLPDEDFNGYYTTYAVDGTNTIGDLITDYFNDNNGQGGLGNWSYKNTLLNFLHGKYDSEVDKYTVNVGGMHFSFKIRFNGNNAEPVYLSKHGNKVEIAMKKVGGGSTNSNNDEVDYFTVTDTKGIKYRFQTKERRIPQNGDEEMNFQVITSWYLDYIEYLNDQRISFSYTPDTYFDYNFHASGSVTFAAVQGTIESDPEFTAPDYSAFTNEVEMNRQLLDKISFPKGSIDFEYMLTSVGTPNNGQSRMVYKSMTLKPASANPNPEAVKTFEFSYSGNRDYLDQIKRNDSAYFEFQYYDNLTLPEFINDENDLALAQDYWKFYNGAVGNQSAINIPNSQYTADKDPDFSSARLGALKNIIYPTKGYTQISYCQNQIVSDNVLDSQYYDDLQPTKRIPVNFTSAGLKPYDSEATDYHSVSRTYEFEQPTLAHISHGVQMVGNVDLSDDISFRISRSDSQDWYSVSYQGVTIPRHPSSDVLQYYNAAPYLRQQIQQREFPITYPPMYPRLFDQYEGEGGFPDDYTVSYDSGNKVLIMPGTYTFEISSENNLTTQATAYINVQLYGEFNEETPEFVNKDVGGIRVSQLKDCPDGNSANCVTRDFSYNDENGLSTGALSVIPQSKTIRNYSYRLEGSNVYYNREVHHMLSNPFTVADPSIGTPVYYSKVSERISGGTDIGHVERVFSFPTEDNSFQYPNRPTGKDLDKAVQTDNLVYEEGNIGPVSQSTTTYDWVQGFTDTDDDQDINDNHPWSLKVYAKKDINADFQTCDYQAYPDDGTPAEDCVKLLHGVLKYRELDSWDRPKKVEATQDGIASVTEYKYDANQQLVEQRTFDSKGNTSIGKTYYPTHEDFQADLISQGMVAKNQISQPVVSESYYNGVLMGQTKIDYALNALGYKPSLTYSAKGTQDLEPRLALHYDDQGNVTQVDQLAKAPTGQSNPLVLRSTAYIWGYDKEYLLAKVDNATHAQVNATGYSASVVNDLDSSSQAIQDEMDTVRNGLSSSLITSYTYFPLIGIKNVTDARDYIMSYEYDEFNRLKTVRDQQNKLLTDYEYGYKNWTSN